MDKVKIVVLRQGNAVPGKTGYMLKQAGDVATFYIDGWGDTGEIHCFAFSTHRIGDKVYPFMWLDDGHSDEHTQIYFPEYEGWKVFATMGGKVMSVCLRWD